jgi:rubredoxin
MFRRQTQEAKSYEVLGHQLRCPICQHDSFTMRRSLLNTRGLTFLDLDWANRRATNFVCAQCGYILWFMPK